ncbi:hypothetical protein ACPXCE_00650 [Streptomyces sp. DT24]|uniref:hypothetical protein n=1 Tax=unclassified Streptomyces TaxID=2593676 RepID=UPI0023B95DF4|nr:hypothetical protein [Streptomyces sp. AM 4-1-1]WEH36529.1 hypothetical protein PZB75_26155 [Streptomyces sp. AM 4-1-1]
MDQYDSRGPSGGPQHPGDATPIYDRLLAEWQAASCAPGPTSSTSAAPSRASGLVPAARTSGDAHGS